MHTNSTLNFNPPQCDLVSETFLGNVSQLDEYCRDKGFHAWFETSAKDNTGIDEAARCLVAKVSLEPSPFSPLPSPPLSQTFIYIHTL